MNDFVWKCGELRSGVFHSLLLDVASLYKTPSHNVLIVALTIYSVEVGSLVRREKHDMNCDEVEMIPRFKSWDSFDFDFGRGRH